MARIPGTGIPRKQIYQGVYTIGSCKLVVGILGGPIYRESVYTGGIYTRAGVCIPTGRGTWDTHLLALTPKGSHHNMYVALLAKKPM